MKRISWKQKWTFSTPNRKREIQDNIMDVQGWSRYRVKVLNPTHLGNGVWRFTVMGSKKSIQEIREWVS